MSYLALYRKYRPITFDDVYGQEEVVTVIRNAIINNKISHAYLFSGPRGTGKTTIAKIIARLVNCDNLVDGKPCGKCFNCVNFASSNDIVEIDAASNNGVDEIRELRDKINLVPSNAKYKVYIIDEVHMLTNQAFNALLKTLEEPPGHVIFILATTEPHKIPLTIASRCQKFKFSKIDDDRIVDRLKYIAKEEEFSCDDDAYYEIARLSDGCMRDAINLLDQLVAYSNGNITIEDIYKVNGSVSYEDINAFLKYICDNDKIKIIEFVNYFNKTGKEINKFIEELIIYLKDVILYRNAGFISNIGVKNIAIKEIDDLLDDNLIYSLVEELNKIQNNIKTSSHGSILFMTSILSFANVNNSGKSIEVVTEVKEEKVEQPKVELQKEEKEILVDSIKDKPHKEIKEVSSIDVLGRVNNALATASKGVLKEYKDKWNIINDYLFDEKYSSVVGILKDSDVVVASNEYAILSSNLDSIVARINENYELIQELLGKIFDNNLLIVALSNEKWNDIKKKYISDIKSGNKYVVKKLDEKEKNKEEKTAVDDLIDLVGNSVIEYK